VRRVLLALAGSLLTAACVGGTPEVTTTTAPPSTTTSLSPTTTSTATTGQTLTTTSVASDPGFAWARIEPADVFTRPGKQLMFSVTAGGPGLVAGGYDGDFDIDAAVWLSTDGFAWSRVPHDEAVFAGEMIRSLTAGGPGLVAVGSWLWVSADGFTWSRITPDGADFGVLNSVVAGGPGLVAVGYDTSEDETDAAVLVSADGYTWTRIEDDAFHRPDEQIIESVTSGGPGLVAVGYDRSGDGTDAAVWVSDDGYHWTRVEDDATLRQPGDQYMQSVTTWGPGLVAVGYEWPDDGRSAAVWVSADGYAWTRIEDDAAFRRPGEQVIESVTAGGPGLVAVGWNRQALGEFDGAVWVSADGYAWTRLQEDAAFGPWGKMFSVTAWGPGLVAVGYASPGDDPDAAVWVSPPPLP
jgi:hypothetical protein